MATSYDASGSYGSATPTLGQKLLGRWWRRQSPARQDRYATLAPLASVLLFLAAIIATFWYLRNEEIARESESVKRDTEIAQQQIRLRLIENQEQLMRLARMAVARELDPEEFPRQAIGFSSERPEVSLMAWLSPKRQPRASYAPPLYRADAGAQTPLPERAQRNARGERSPRNGAAASATAAAAAQATPPSPQTEAEWAFIASRDMRQPVYSRAFRDAGGLQVFQLHLPLVDRDQFIGTLVLEYSVEALLRHFVPPDVAHRHRIELIDERERVLASTVAQAPVSQRSAIGSERAIRHEAPLAPAANGLVLRGNGYRTSAGLVGNTLFWMVVALSVLTVWMLLGAWRHMRRRGQIQHALMQETNFRRAMENSMLTGMRAMDREGRITYVNPAFLAMTGFTESDIVGRMPPFPYWPADRIEENRRLLQQELQGRSPAGGIEVKVMRKDGSLFDARMYVSPLVDARGQQTGWMTSMTNITESKRIRDQLSASHERFTTVLEGLDAAVSVLSVQQGELLFANRSYRLWFGAEGRGHALLASGRLPLEANGDDNDAVDALGGLPTQSLTDSGSDTREVYAPALDKWFDVRSRYLQWTDGRLAQMIIATDVTERRLVEEQASLQAERAQNSSRLITMGEMASSVAHELNQPLTAIINYCNGMVTRVKGDSISETDLVAALEKTARQAERAGQIIHRIRNFVKKSGPQRQPSQARVLVDDALELASIELKRRNVQIHSYVAHHLPDLLVDPILIEQVILNLVKNAAEAIDNAKLPALRRNIELRVVPRHTPEEGGVVEFAVTDMGPGLPEEVIARLYEAFFSTKADGMGIGLSLCRSIVESHQGRIKAQNLYNGGSVAGCRFAFTLPVDTNTRTELPQPLREATTQATSSTAP